MNTLITVTGVVQGVGFRPFIARIAKELSINGTVMNCGGIVIINAEYNDTKILSEFVDRIKNEQPYGAEVRDLIIKKAASADKFKDFTIILSEKTGYSNEIPLIPIDLPVCGECRNELFDTQNRRFLYPFISCVACGPRYSIIRELPYDRERISMDVFSMCNKCEKEYADENNRRRHAQTISCHDCGPQLILQYKDQNTDKKTVLTKYKALTKSIELINSGYLLAIKGIGGYQLACLPNNDEAVSRLRMLKHRNNKPFAIMFPSIDVIKEYCKVNSEEEKLLISNARPIVLLRKLDELSDNALNFSTSVCSDSLFIGAFLPYTPLHVLLTNACGPLVMTSGNLTNEPIIISDEEILDIESEHLMGVLYNQREILTPLDDSVTRIAAGNKQIIRRSRGYVPEPIFLKQKTDRTILASGGDLKSAFCLYKGDRAYLSQYFGDLDNLKVSRLYLENIEKMKNLFDIEPDLIVCDMHPNYISTKIAEKYYDEMMKGNLLEKSIYQRQIYNNIETICDVVDINSAEKSFDKRPVFNIQKVQHHHAHAASVMAENNLQSSIAVVFDGTGYGTDGAIWGGEFLLCNNGDFERKGHFGYVTLCGGDAVSVDASQSLKCYLYAAGIDSPVAGLDVDEIQLIESAIFHKIQTHESSSTGRLFDVVSALLDIRNKNTFEGECAIALEKEAVLFNEKYPEYTNELFFDIDFDKNEIIVDQIGFIKKMFCARIMLFEKDIIKNTINLSKKTNSESEQQCDKPRIAVENIVDVCNNLNMEPFYYKGLLSYSFHNALTDMVHRVCLHIRKNCEENRVVLSGGVFANVLLLESCVKILEESGFIVYINRQVPTNDGGISLGQAWIAGCKVN